MVFALKTGPVRINALRRELDGITQKVLGQTLQRLDKNGLVKRHVVTHPSPSLSNTAYRNSEHLSFPWWSSYGYGQSRTR